MTQHRRNMIDDGQSAFSGFATFGSLGHTKKPAAQQSKRIVCVTHRLRGSGPGSGLSRMSVRQFSA